MLIQQNVISFILRGCGCGCGRTRFDYFQLAQWNDGADEKAIKTHSIPCFFLFFLSSSTMYHAKSIKEKTKKTKKLASFFFLFFLFFFKEGKMVPCSFFPFLFFLLVVDVDVDEIET